MTRHTTKWGKAVFHAMIDKEMILADVADKLGMSRAYCSAVVSGRVYSKNAVKQISDLLNIPDEMQETKSEMRDEESITPTEDERNAE